MAADPRLICPSTDLEDGGPGVKFSLAGAGGELAAFAVCFRGRVYAYVNRCPHRGTELDWDGARFFDESGLYLVCATHGALYDPADGACLGGPCGRAGLEPLRVTEHDGRVTLHEE